MQHVPFEKREGVKRFGKSFSTFLVLQFLSLGIFQTHSQGFFPISFPLISCYFDFKFVIERHTKNLKMKMDIRYGLHFVRCYVKCFLAISLPNDISHQPMVRHLSLVCGSGALSEVRVQGPVQGSGVLFFLKVKIEHSSRSIV